MKRLLLSLALLACFVVGAKAAPTAKAIYCSGNTTVYFTYDEVAYNTSTAYDQLDGQKPTKIYNNISSTGYLATGGYSINMNDHDNPIIRSKTYDNCPWSRDYSEYCTTAKFLPNFIDWKPTAIDSWFYFMDKLTSIEGAEYFNTSEVTSMNGTFFYCKGLTDFSFLKDWDVSKVTNFRRTFHVCAGMTTADALKDWDVSSATSFNSMFAHCVNLSDISALDNWKDKLKNLVSLNSFFEYCYDLTNVDALSDWEFEVLRDLSSTFRSCDNLSDIGGLRKWNVSTVDDLWYTFAECISIENLDDLSEWDTGSVTRMKHTFYMWNYEYTSTIDGQRHVSGDNPKLTNIEGIRNWDVKNVMFIDQLFDGCMNLTSIEPIEGWKMPELRSMGGAFNNCLSLTGRIDLSGWDLSKLEYESTFQPPGYEGDSYYYSYNALLGKTFNGCENVVGITFGKGTVGCEEIANKVATAPYMNSAGAWNKTFTNCPKLRYIDLTGMTDPYANIAKADRDDVVHEDHGTWSMDAYDMFYGVPRTCVIYLPSGNVQPTTGDLENVVYTASDNTLQCDKYYSEDKVDIELPHRFHADLATYERPAGNVYGSVMIPYPVKMEDSDDAEFQPFLLKHELNNHMFFEGSLEVAANTPFVYKRKTADDMTFRMEDIWVESTYDVDGATADNIHEDFAWTAQGFYVNHEIPSRYGVFMIPTKDDYPGTVEEPYGWDHVYYLAKNRFYRSDDFQPMKIAPHRVLFYGLWEKYNGIDPEFAPSEFTFEEVGLVDAIKEAEMRQEGDKAAAIYDANGNRLNEMQRGLNILRMSDGTVKKVIMK